MRQHLNTLFITLEGAYLRKNGQAIEVRHDGATKLRVPLHNLDGVVTFGWDITATAALMHACAENNITLSFHSPHGKFLSSTRGPISGNVLLRREQYRQADLPSAALAIAKNIVAAKIANSRTVLMRAARDYGEQHPEKGYELQKAADYLKHRIRMVAGATSVESLLGFEGEAATIYFAQFSHLFTKVEEGITFNGRTKRPPTDPFNAVLSLLYVLSMHDCRSACESCGIDPQCGFLHQDRPGRYSLALDLQEEFRAIMADRLAFSLINRKQLTKTDFDHLENGAVVLKDAARKLVLGTWQERKQETILHPFLDEKTTFGLLPFLQAKLMARYLRGDLDAYPAFIWK